MAIMMQVHLEMVMPFPRPDTVPPVTTMYFISPALAIIARVRDRRFGQTARDKIRKEEIRGGFV